MSKKPHIVVLHESAFQSITSDTFTFAVTAGLILLADGRSVAWQIITIAMFVFWFCARASALGKVLRFYSKSEVLKWVQSLPDDEETEWGAG